MPDDVMIKLVDVWKKYSKSANNYGSLREDIAFAFSKRHKPDELKSGEFWVLKDFNFEVKKGESVGLYGQNGVGKSTILKLISGVTYPNRGKIEVNGKVAPLLEIGAGFHQDLTGRENIYMNGAILGMKLKEIKQKENEIIEFSGIRGFIDTPVKKYSSGMYLRLAFSVAIHSEADIYLFDEILAVGDEEFQKKCFDKIMEIKEKGLTFLIVSHNEEFLKKHTNYIHYLGK